MNASVRRYINNPFFNLVAKVELMLRLLAFSPSLPSPPYPLYPLPPLM